MSPLEFDHQLRKRVLRLRQVLNRTGQCWNNQNDYMRKLLVASVKSSLRLEASSKRLANCLRAHGVAL